MRVHGRLRYMLRRVWQEAFLFYWRRRVKAERFAHFGKRSLIFSPRGVLSRHRIEIGDDVLIHEGAMFSVVERFNGRDHQPRLRIGSGTNIGNGAWFSCVGEIEVGERNLWAPNVMIADSYHEYHDPDTPIIEQPMAWPEPVRIGPGCFIGSHAAVLGGVTVGANTFIAANAVLTRSVPANCVVAGNPARVIREYERGQAEWVSRDSGAGAPDPLSLPPYTARG